MCYYIESRWLIKVTHGRCPPRERGDVRVYTAAQPTLCIAGEDAEEGVVFPTPGFENLMPSFWRKVFQIHLFRLLAKHQTVLCRHVNWRELKLHLEVTPKSAIRNWEK